MATLDGKEEVDGDEADEAEELSDDVEWILLKVELCSALILLKVELGSACFLKFDLCCV
jgi:hypothetical protein